MKKKMFGAVVIFMALTAVMVGCKLNQRRKNKEDDADDNCLGCDCCFCGCQHGVSDSDNDMAC